MSSLINEKFYWDRLFKRHVQKFEVDLPSKILKVTTFYAQHDRISIM
jgi:hypothetical protein